MAADTSLVSNLFSPGDVARLTAAWVCVWVLLHHMCWAVWKHQVPVLCNPTPTERYRFRLCRGQVYNLIAVIGGCILIMQCETWPKDLLYSFRVEHQVLFSMAAAHWIVSIWEDHKCKAFLQAGLGDSVGPFGLWREFLPKAYLLHHVVAGAGYVAILRFHTCSAIGSFGLIFELPALFMNHREFIVNANQHPRWYFNAAVVKFHNRMNTAFILGRYTPSFFYMYSIIFWREDLAALGTMERIMYHGMAIFFTFLNFGLHTHVFGAWSLSDRDAYAPRFAHGLAATVYRRSAARVMGEDQVDPKVNLAVETPLMVSPSTLEEYDGTTEHEQKPGVCDTWIEIDCGAYNVTDFMKEHPGGEAVLREHAGKDASAAFRRARHSLKAKMMMQKYRIGPIQRRTNAYRIFEHGGHEGLILQATVDILTNIFSFGIPVFLITRTPLVGLEGSGSSLWQQLVPGLLLSSLSGLAVFVFNCFRCDWSGFFNRRGYVCGAAAMLLQVGLTLARLPMADSLPSSCPTGLEISAVALLFLEDAIAAYKEGVIMTRSFVLSIGMVVLSVSIRGVWMLSGAAPGHALAPFLVAPTLSCLVRRVGDDGDWHQMANEVLSGMQLASVFSFWTLLALTYMSPEVAISVGKFQGMAWASLTGAVFVANACTVGVLVVVNSAYLCSPAWAARTVSVALLLGTFFSGGVVQYRWLFLFGALGMFAAVGRRSRDLLKKLADSGNFETLPDYIIGTQAVWDQTRVTLCVLVWSTLWPMLKSIVNWFKPQELQFVGCDNPIFDMGEGVDLGIAAYYSPARDAGAWYGTPAWEIDKERAGVYAETPHHFVCHVGHFDRDHAAGLTDLNRSMAATTDCWSEFHRGEASGLLSNVTCIFPNIGGTTLAKEVNFQAWQSSEHAEKWQSESPGHSKVLADRNSRLGTTGNKTAHLHPRELRFQDRCARCARLVESTNVGSPPPLRCQDCNAATFGYPIL